MKKIVCILICILLIGCGKVDKPIIEEKLNEPFNGKIVNIYVFYGDGCRYCENLFSFLDNIDAEYKKYFEIKKYETWGNEDNHELMKSVASAFNEEYSGVPYYIIGDQSFKGYNATFNDKIKETIKNQYYNESLIDIMDKLGM